MAITCSLAPPWSGPFKAPMAEVMPGVNVGQGSDGNPGSEGGGVQLVIGMENQSFVKGFHLNVFRLGTF